MSILIIVLYVVANIQLIYIACRFKGEAWLLLRATPNRYLYSLLFLPVQLYINLCCIEQLCALLPAQHSLLFFLTPYLITVYTVIFSVLFTTIDYFNGNSGYTDLKYPYNISVIRARDAILKQIVSDNTWKCTSPPTSRMSVNDKLANSIALGKTRSISVLVNYIRTINKKVHSLTDRQMWSLNLFNVLVFVGSVFWTIGCCILLYVIKQTGVPVGQLHHFETICNLQLVSVFIIVMWLQFRAYEFAELADIGWMSREQIDLWFAGLVITACMILIAIAKSSPDPIKYLGVLSLVIPMYNLRIRQHVREFCGSWMTALNLTVIVILESLVLSVLCVIMYA